ncbi:hypothetical protein A2Y99_01980 [Candidatus Gottesmanbacteria bacterium RBG_13_37_7]|uniref:Uncharacterized protein n=1 Tax=Candidatus Gottesmanbacteria bacterium RBG_13_37_7 TaxID=1798369 RepID=A0A1F5YHN2_9BACT|nr:MAG: hypothetical protein A2Y99_01980 [Candidatus Gottesmanbacteria bacterium RBG_13_37_7]
MLVEIKPGTLFEASDYSDHFLVVTGTKTYNPDYFFSNALISQLGEEPLIITPLAGTSSPQNVRLIICNLPPDDCLAGIILGLKRSVISDLPDFSDRLERQTDNYRQSLQDPPKTIEIPD